MNGIEYNKQAIECFKQIAMNEIINCYDPEQDDPINTWTVPELCESVYKQGINQEQAVYGARMRVLYIPKALRYQGKAVLKAHVAMAVRFAFMDWAMEGNDFSFLTDGKEGCGIRVDAWAEGVA